MCVGQISGHDGLRLCTSLAVSVGPNLVSITTLAGSEHLVEDELPGSGPR